MQSIARLNTSQLKISTILSDISNSIDRSTLEKYVNIYRDIYLTFEVLPWNSNIRSKYRIIEKEKTYFCDPSIGLYLLGVNSNQQLYRDLKTLGIYFENLVIKDLNVFCELNLAKLYFYRDEKGNEIDVIILMPNGNWSAIEIKFAIDEEQAENVAKKLDYVISLISSNSVAINSKPNSRIIITSNGIPFETTNGVKVIPFTKIKLD